ncbi:MAG: hypothetical protein WA083_04095 [Candidatus Moraniibacteriota bacterium]
MEILNYKIIISLIAVALSFVGYGIYIRDVLRKKTIPHSFTFFIWGLTSSIIWALQVYGGAGVGAWVTLSVALICIFIFFLSLKYGEKNITLLDIVFLLISLLALILWFFAKMPIWSMILLTAIEFFGFAPTIRKSWNKPQEESLLTWEITAFRHGLSIFALQSFNVLTLLYPVVWVFVNLLFSIFLIVRRRQLAFISH